ncbi:MAG: serine protease, partial [Bacteroidota bacterium]
MILFFASLTLFGYVNPDYTNPVINVVNATADAVVKIDVERTVSTSVDPFMEEFFKRFFGEQQNPFGTE